MKRSRNDEKERMLLEAMLVKALMIEVLGVLIRKDVFPSDEFIPCFKKAMEVTLVEWGELPSGVTSEGVLQGLLDTLAIVRSVTVGK